VCDGTWKEGGRGRTSHRSDLSDLMYANALKTSKPVEQSLGGNKEQ
jgi:hypothetical protein